MFVVIEKDIASPVVHGSYVSAFEAENFAHKLRAMGHTGIEVREE